MGSVTSLEENAGCLPMLMLLELVFPGRVVTTAKQTADINRTADPLDHIIFILQT